MEAHVNWFFGIPGPHTTALCADCGAEMPGHDCDPVDIERRRLVAIMESTLRHPMDDAQRAVVDRAIDEHLMDDDRGYSTEDDDRVPPEYDERRDGE